VSTTKPTILHERAATAARGGVPLRPPNRSHRQAAGIRLAAGYGPGPLLVDGL